MNVCLNLNDNHFNTNTFNCNLQLFLGAISTAEDPMLHSQVLLLAGCFLGFLATGVKLIQIGSLQRLC